MLQRRSRQPLPDLYRIENGFGLPCASNAFIIKDLPHFETRRNGRRRKGGQGQQPRHPTQTGRRQNRKTVSRAVVRQPRQDPDRIKNRIGTDDDNKALIGKDLVHFFDR